MFGELLGLGLQWRACACAFHKDQGRVELEIEHTDEVWQRERCPQYGAAARGYDRTERCAGGSSMSCSIAARSSAVCRAGAVRSAATPGECARRGRARQAGSARSGKPSPWGSCARGRSERLAQMLGETAPRRWRLLHQHVDAAYAEADFSDVCCVGVDEMSVRQGHKCISVFADLIQKRVLFAAEDRDASVFPALDRGV